MLIRILQRGIKEGSGANRIGLALFLLFAAALAYSLIQGLRTLRVY